MSDGHRDHSDLEQSQQALISRLDQRFRRLCPADQIAILARIAARVLPALSRLFELNSHSNRPQKPELLLPVFRGCLTALGATISKNNETLEAATYAADRIDVFSYLAQNTRFRAESARLACLFVCDQDGARNYFVDSITASLNYLRAATDFDEGRESDAGFIACNAVLNTVKMDFDTIETGSFEISLAERPLWQSSEVPLSLRHRSRSLEKVLIEGGPNWDFWSRWYRMLWHGTPLNLVLQNHVSLIKDDSWQEGGNALARRIEEIEYRTELSLKLDQFYDLLREQHSLRGIGHNNPPSDVSTQSVRQAIPQELTDHLTLIEEQIVEPAPSRENLAKTRNWLLEVLSQSSLWAFKKAELGVDEFAKATGKLAGGATIAWILSHSASIRNGLSGVVEALVAWINAIV